MNKQDDSYYGWVFTGVDNSQEAAQKYPRDEMIGFTRPVIDSLGRIVIQQLSVPRFGFTEEVHSLPKEDPRRTYFSGLKRQVDFGTQDICPTFYESIA